MDAGDCPPLNMNAMHNYLLSHFLNKSKLSYLDKDIWSIRANRVDQSIHDRDYLGQGKVHIIYTEIYVENQHDYMLFVYSVFRKAGVT